MTAAAFETRLARLIRKHRRMASAGVAYRIARDGLISAHPRRRVAVAFPLRPLALLLLGAVAFKAVLLATLGGEAYASRLADLASGSVVERAGVWVMQADPATLAAAGFLEDALR